MGCFDIEKPQAHLRSPPTPGDAKEKRTTDVIQWLMGLLFGGGTHAQGRVDGMRSGLARPGDRLCAAAVFWCRPIWLVSRFRIYVQ